MPRSTGSEEVTRLDAFVVGTGFGGMYALYKLREMGLSVTAVEAGDGVGGTWYWNRYPGARCDVLSIDYCYSFPEIQQEWTWTERFAPQPQILAYANFVAEKLGLLKDIQFETRATAIAYDDDRKLWRIETENSANGVRIFEVTWCILATGPLSVPKGIDIPGAATFRGETYLSARWPKHRVDLAGKRVGLIGTGSSGIQITPVVAEIAEHLYVFQRTPSFSVPARNRPNDPDFMAQIKAHYTGIREIAKMSYTGGSRAVTSRPFFSVGIAEREKLMEQGWQDGAYALLSMFSDTLTNQEANDIVADFVRGKIDTVVKDPAIAEKLKPYGYPVFSRRPVLDTNYYEAFNRDNVTLVDCIATPIEEITPAGIRTSAEEIALDVIIAATGFDAFTGALMAIDIKGRGGCSLREKWADGPRNYLGLSMAGFPNLFTIAAANGPSALANFVVLNEQNVDWICDCIRHMREAGYSAVEATQEAEDRWVDHVALLASRSLIPKANTWYTGTNIAGKPRIFPIYIAGLGRYTDLCNDVAARGYEGMAFA